jgi:hypothetical protein
MFRTMNMMARAYGTGNDVLIIKNQIIVSVKGAFLVEYITLWVMNWGCGYEYISNVLGADIYFFVKGIMKRADSFILVLALNSILNKWL